MDIVPAESLHGLLWHTEQEKASTEECLETVKDVLVRQFDCWSLGVTAKDITATEADDNILVRETDCLPTNSLSKLIGLVHAPGCMANSSHQLNCLP